MRRFTPAFVAFPLSAVLVLGCDTKQLVEPTRESRAPLLAKGGPNGGSEFATLSKLPALSSNVHGEAYAVDQVGSLIAGYSWDTDGRVHPATWRLQNGKWTLTTLPYAATATSARARAVNDHGDVAGNDFPSTSPHVVLWPSTGGFNVLGCGDFGEGYAISAGGQIVVGIDRTVSPMRAAVWQPGSCREDLPPLVAGGGADATAINGDGTIVGGSSGFPVRWRRVSDAWQIEQLDSRPGSVYGANSAGDLVGSVQVPCSVESCTHGIIWYAAGGSRDIGTLGGETTAPRGINAAREVVGLSTQSNGSSAPFFWSETLGMRALPVANGGWAFAVSGLRSNGTRLVVGAGGNPFSALVWVVSNP